MDSPRKTEQGATRHSDAGAYDKYVKKEARALIKNARKALKRGGDKVATSAREDIVKLCDELDERLGESGREGEIRTLMARLSRRSDKHLAFAAKTPFREYFDSIGVAIAFTFLLRAFAFEAFKIPSSSMVPTLEIGDHIFVNKIIYGLRIPFTTIKYFDFRKPKHGEVIVFINPCVPEKDYIKRVVATEGDSVEVRCDALYVNNKKVVAQRASEQCSYWDSDDVGTHWWEETCSRYTEDHGDAHYSTLY